MRELSFAAGEGRVSALLLRPEAARVLLVLALLRPALAGPPRAALHVAEGADQGFAVARRAGSDVAGELARAIARFAGALA